MIIVNIILIINFHCLLIILAQKFSQEIILYYQLVGAELASDFTPLFSTENGSHVFWDNNQASLSAPHRIWTRLNVSLRSLSRPQRSNYRCLWSCECTSCDYRYYSEPHNGESNLILPLSSSLGCSSNFQELPSAEPGVHRDPRGVLCRICDARSSPCRPSLWLHHVRSGSLCREEIVFAVFRRQSRTFLFRKHLRRSDEIRPYSIMYWLVNPWVSWIWTKYVIRLGF